MTRYYPLRSWMLTDTGAGPMLSAADAIDWSSGAFCVEMEFAMSDWTPATDQEVAQQGTVDGNLGWTCEILTTGAPRASFYDLGTLATKIGAAGSVPNPPLVDGEPYGIRFHALSDIFGVASTFVYELRRGNGIWQSLGAGNAALVGTPFPSTAPLDLGRSTVMTKLYDFRWWNTVFGPAQLTRRAVTAEPRISLHRPASGWTDEFGKVWTVGAAQYARTDSTPSYAA